MRSLWVIILLVGFSAAAHAAERPGYFSSGTLFGDGAETDYTIPPYLNDPKTPNNAQWNVEEWTAARWGVPVRGADPNGVIARFYDAGLITDESEQDDMPSVEVSDLFLRLSDQDKGRVMATYDAATRTTSEYGGFYVVHDPTDTVLGAFTPSGLQLQ